MMNTEVLEKIQELVDEYEYNWGQKLDILNCPLNISQEELLIILERIVDTGESIVVGYKKCF